MLNIETFRTYCLAKPGVTEECPFGPDTLVYKVGGKIFALSGLDTDIFSVNLKADPEYVIELRERHPAVQPGYHMNKKHWNTIEVDALNDEKLFLTLVDHSYDCVVAAMPKRLQKLLTSDTP